MDLDLSFSQFSQLEDEKYQKHKFELIDRAHKKGYVKWNKVYENSEKDSRIWHLSFKKFYYKDYRKNKRFYISIFENKQSIKIETTNDKRHKISSYIFTFKNNKLRFYSVNADKKLKARSLLDNRIQNFECANALKFIFTDITKSEGLQKYQKRLVNLLIKKCRKNKIKLPYKIKEAKSLKDAGARIIYPFYADLAEITNNNININDYNDVTKKLTSKFKKPFKKAIKSICGSNSKILSKRIIEGNGRNLLSKILLINILKNLVPLDYIQKIDLDKIHKFYDDRDVNSKKNIALFLNNFKNRPEFIANCFENTFEDFIFKDSIKQYIEILKVNKDYKIENLKTIREIHDLLSKVLYKLQSKDIEIKNNEKLLSSNVDNYEFNYNNNRYNIVIPKTKHELFDWGKEMNNCIGSYYDRIGLNYSWILGIKNNDNRIAYGIEISPQNKEIIQFRGNYNESAPQELYDIVEKILWEKEIINSDKLDCLKNNEKLLLNHE